MSATIEKRKPLGGRAYRSIPHFPGSRIGPGDHKCDAGQLRIATVKARDEYDRIIVQEKLDGTCVSVARIDGAIVPLIRAGYIATESHYEQHWRFGEWVYANQHRFLAVLRDGERLCGEWLMQAHGTRYQLPHEPFVVFDLMTGQRRHVLTELMDRAAVGGAFTLPRLIHCGGPFSIEQALEAIKTSGHGAIDPVEGAIWRVERNEIKDRTLAREWRVDFLAKYVRPDKVDGCYLPVMTGNDPTWNWRPRGMV